MIVFPPTGVVGCRDVGLCTPRSSLTEGLYRCDEVTYCLPDQVGLNQIRHRLLAARIAANPITDDDNVRLAVATTASNWAGLHTVAKGGQLMRTEAGCGAGLNEFYEQVLFVEGA